MIPIAHPMIREEEQAAIIEVLQSGQLAQGAKVRLFEEEFAAWCGVDHAVAVSSGTAALHLALLAHDIGAGAEVITTPFSFIASANCVLYTGARPCFADIEADYFTIDPVKVAERITPQTRAIIAVHLYGQLCDMTAIAMLAEKHGLILIEDACQAHGAKLNGEMVGTWGTACYSFYPTKNMTTGEGGIVTTNDARIAQRVRMLRNHGMAQRYIHEMLGYNLRMTDLQAAIGLVQLKRLEVWNQKRQANAAHLSAQLQGVPSITTPMLRPGATHVFHQYTIRTAYRDRLAERLQQRGIGVGIHYPIPIHQQPFYRDLGYVDCLQNAELASHEVLSLPVHPLLDHGDLTCIVEAVVEEAAHFV
ncbi:MAG: DegT/DnrJ/EryC1/StrS family aminotransferase [Caldilineaceae bacterium]